MDTRTHPHRARLQSLREHLHALKVDAVVIPSSDPHLSEYLPARWEGRAWLSGFTGSAGTLVVAMDRAALFADSRYWVQAERELQGSGIDLVRVPTGAPSHVFDWIVEALPKQSTVAVDAQVLSLGWANGLRAALDAASLHLRTDVDVLDAVWDGRPGMPAQPIYEHNAPFAVNPRAQRLASVREAMQRHGASHHLVSTVDDVAWITCLRGSDVEYNPVFLAHLLVTPHGARLYVGADKLNANSQAKLRADGFEVVDYARAASDLAALPADAVVLVDPKRITLGLRLALPTSVRAVEAINPSTLAKSRKERCEAVHVRETMIEDGAAMCRFYAWFEQALGRERITELTVAERLNAERARAQHFVGLSFPVIAGYNANGALPHYRATESSFAAIEGNGLLLIDSGGQYLGGTTDITRVWPIGHVSPAMRRDYTLVLKGTIALSRAKFPRGTLSPMLDALARAPLWEHGLDYGHGTGHGVGYFLNVHEGPQSISKAIPDPSMAMELGMITSIEPGLYREGRWGIRIENLVMNVEAPSDEFGEFQQFETLSLCPIDTRCIDASLMRTDEVAWLDDYHATVRRRLAPRVQDAALAWLMERTKPLAG